MRYAIQGTAVKQKETQPTAFLKVSKVNNSFF
jgi:hypothetical protein